MRESTEGKWVNRIEEFWVRIDDRSKSVVDSTKLLFNAIAQRITRMLDRIVGSRVISPRLIGLSGCISFATTFFIFGLVMEILADLILRYHDIFQQHTHDIAALDRGLPLIILLGYIFFGIAAVYVCLAVLAVNLKSPVWAWLSCFPTVTVVFLFLRVIYLHQLSGVSASIVVATFISLASDVLLLVVIRQSLTWMSSSTSLLRLSGALVLQLSLVVLLCYLPFHIAFVETRVNPRGALAGCTSLVGFLNIPTAFASASFMLALLLVLFHRATWPVLSRAAYVLTRNNVLDKRRMIRSVAVALILYGLSGIPEMSLFVKLLRLLNK
jgi:hypothetical protein